MFISFFWPFLYLYIKFRLSYANSLLSQTHIHAHTEKTIRTEVYYLCWRYTFYKKTFSKNKAVPSICHEGFGGGGGRRYKFYSFLAIITCVCYFLRNILGFCCRCSSTLYRSFVSVCHLLFVFVTLHVTEFILGFSLVLKIKSKNCSRDNV